MAKAKNPYGPGHYNRLSEQRQSGIKPFTQDWEGSKDFQQKIAAAQRWREQNISTSPPKQNSA